MILFKVQNRSTGNHKRLSEIKGLLSIHLEFLWSCPDLLQSLLVNYGTLVASHQGRSIKIDKHCRPV